MRRAARNLATSSNKSFCKPVAHEDVAATFRPTAGEIQPMYFFYDGEDEAQCGSECLDDFRATLTEAHAVCRDEGIQFVFLFVPKKYRVYGRFCEIGSGLRRRFGHPGDLPRRLGLWTPDTD